MNIFNIRDADIIHADIIQSYRNIEFEVRKNFVVGAILIILGADHSISIPCINALDDQDPIHLVQIDTHLDFDDERRGVSYGRGNPMRRPVEKPCITGLTQLGIRNVSPTAREGYADACAMGSHNVLLRQVRKLSSDTF